MSHQPDDIGLDPATGLRVLDALEDFAYVLDRSGHFLYANRALLDLWGRDLHDVVGKDFEDLGFPDELVELHERQIRTVVETGEPLKGENPYTSPHGHTGYYEYIFVPLPDPDGEIRRIAGITRDITERKKAEDALIGSLAREHAAVATAEAKVWEERALREATMALASSFSTEEMVRRIAASAVSALEADGGFVERIDPTGEWSLEMGAAQGRATEPPGREGIAYEGSATQWAVRHGSPFSVDRVEESDLPFSSWTRETYAHCSAVIAPLMNGSEPVGGLFVFRDRARRQPFDDESVERVQAFVDLSAMAFQKLSLLEQSERRRRELERVTRSRARLVRGFTHDVMNPLGAAKGALKLLEDGIVGELDSQQEEQIQRTVRSLDSAIDLIEDFLEIARSEAAELEIDRAPTLLSHLSYEVAEDHRSAAESKGLRLDVEVPGSLPVIVSDADRVRQILGNLMSNAVKYTPEGGSIRVRTCLDSCNGGQGEGAWMRVEVEDSGPGIPEEDVPRLFEEFYRSGITRDEPGTGIGLTISRQLARALGGDITVKSEPGSGSTFTLLLPTREMDGEDGIWEIRRPVPSGG